MEDSKIIDLYFAGSDQAIEETSIKYGGYLNQIAYNILRDLSDTEEIVNDTYLGAWNAIPPTRPNSLKHYLSRITRNLSFNRLDYKLAGKRSAVLIELDECIPDKHSEVEIVLEAKEIGILLNDFLSVLDRKNCAIFLARYYYSLTIKEIANDYNLSRRQVRYRLLKLRERLREYFDKEGLVL